MKTRNLLLVLIILVLVGVGGCMSQAVKDGDTIKVHYTGKLEDGSVFDSSEGREPLEFTVGSGMVIKGFDQGVVGMKVGETKKITINPEEAYGVVNEQLVQDVPRSTLPDTIELEKGKELTLQVSTGQVVRATVKDFNNESVTLDLNHPLAGKVLTFEVTLEAIN